MLRRLWLLFAQACTLCLAALFVVATLRPELLGRGAARETGVVLRQETTTPVVTPTVASHADAVRKAMPAVVNIYTKGVVRQRNPLADDPMMRRYFPDLAERGHAREMVSGPRRGRRGLPSCSRQTRQSWRCRLCSSCTRT